LASSKRRNLHIAGSVQAAREYQAQFKGSPAEEYVRKRGLAVVAERLCLGWVGSALTGHERLTGRLAIPYMRPAGGEHLVATVRYRCIADHDCKSHGGDKYKSVPGDTSRIYNSGSLLRGCDSIVVTEGEVDAMSWEAAGVPAIGYQGTGAWRPHFNSALEGFPRVWLIADDDKPGIVAADKRAAELPNARVVVLGGGHDSNSFYMAHGPEKLRERIGL